MRIGRRNEGKGRIQIKKPCELDKQQQTVNAEMLSDGLYFLQVISGGKVLASEKFVKQ